MGRPAILRVDILTDARQAAAGLKRSETGFQKWSGAVKAAAISAAATGAVAIAGLIDAARAAADEAQQIAVLQKALDNLSDGYSYNAQAVAAWIDKIKLGSIQSDDTLRPALVRLLQATDDLKLSQDLLVASMDVAAATGKPLEAVVTAVGKAANGQTAALNRLSPGLGTAAAKTKDAAGLQALLERRFGGADKAASDTASGGLQDLDDILGDLKESIGEELLPVIEDFVDWMKSPEGQKAIKDTASAVKVLAEWTANAAEAFVDALNAFERFQNSLGDGKGFDLPWLNAAAAGPGMVAAPWAYGYTPGPAPYGARAIGSGRMPTGYGAPVVIVQTIDPAAAGVAVRRALNSDAGRRGAPVVIGRGPL